ncbi:MAG: hypothetical protein DMG05_23130 [Acidobacteria bacterium]|nr:MAG: hypothetical protein DMG05_23130 [Acidobacteriota bacterium]
MTPVERESKPEVARRQPPLSVFLGPLLIIPLLFPLRCWRLWERQGLAYTITASQTKRVLGGTFSCYMATAPENEQRAAEGIKDQLKRLMAVSPSDDELRRAKNYSVGIYHIRLQQRTEEVLEYGRSIIQGNTLDEIKQYPQEIQRVDQDMIRGAAMKYIDMERFAWGQVRGSAK